MTWYGARYANDPSTDNIFGREALVERHTPLLQAWLRHGGRLAAFPLRPALPTRRVISYSQQAHETE